MEQFYDHLFIRYSQESKKCLIRDLTLSKATLNNILEGITSYSVHVNNIKKTMIDNKLSSNPPSYGFDFRSFNSLLEPHINPFDLDRVNDFSFDASPFLLICFFNFAIGFVKMLSETPDNQDILKCNRGGENGLHIASNLGHARIIRYMLSTNSPLVYQPDYHGLLPFHAAVYTNRVEIVEEYIDYFNAKNTTTIIDSHDSKGRRPIEVAFQNNYKVLVYVFLLAGCKSDNYTHEYIQNCLIDYTKFKSMQALPQFTINNEQIQ